VKITIMNIFSTFHDLCSSSSFPSQLTTVHKHVVLQ